MNLNQAPRTVIAPDGTTYEPVRVLVVEGVFTVEDRDGAVLVTDAASGLSVGSRVTTIDTTSGRWVSRAICGCGSRKRGLLATWEGA